MQNIIKRNIKNILHVPVLAALTLTLVACSDDTNDIREIKEATLHLRTSAQNYGYAPLLRSVASGYSAYAGIGTDCDILLYLTQGVAQGGNLVYETAQFKWSDTNNWSARVAVEPNKTYYVYGYMPLNAATATINSTDYASGSTMILTGLNTISTQDVCIVTGAKEEANPDDFDIINSPTLVTPGSFSVKVTEGENYIYLLMNHVYAKLGLNFKVEGPSSYYYSLRAIKLKKVEMVTNVGKVTVDVSNGSVSPEMIYHDATPGSESTITLLDVSTDDDDSNDSGIEITPTGLEIPAFFTPMAAGTSKNVKFISTYDVYYRNTDGTISDLLVRENCTATNEWTLKAEGTELGAGKAITINATIIPTYLYQLADPDLADPTIKIE